MRQLWDRRREAHVPQDALHDRRVINHGDQVQALTAPGVLSSILPPFKYTPLRGDQRASLVDRKSLWAHEFSSVRGGLG